MLGKDVVLRAVPDVDDPDSFSTGVTRKRRANGKLAIHEQNELMRELALGEKLRTDLASEYGVSHQYITRFAQRYARLIGKLQANMEDQFAHLWIADKSNRLAVLQRHAAELDRLENPTPEERRVLALIFKQASEELGQLPPRQAVVSARVIHTVEGFTTDEITELLT